MDDPGRFPGRHGDQFKQPALSVGSDHEEPFLSGVLVLDEPDGVAPRVVDEGVRDPVLARRIADLHTSRVP